MMFRFHVSLIAAAKKIYERIVRPLLGMIDCCAQDEAIPAIARKVSR